MAMTPSDTLPRFVRALRPLALSALVTAGACASASQSVPTSALELTARQAYAEARNQALGWSGAAQLQYVEGAAVTGQGTVRRDAGYWRFVFSAPGESQQLAVQVTPTDVQAEQRAPQSPPGFIIGERTLGGGWIDSDAALAPLPPLNQGTRVPMLLVPAPSESWYVTLSDGRVQVDAASGRVVR